MGKCNATKIKIHRNVVTKYANIYPKTPQNLKIWQLLKNIVLTGIAVSIRNGKHIFNNLICPECNNSHSSFVQVRGRKQDLTLWVCNLSIQLVEVFQGHLQ